MLLATWHLKPSRSPFHILFVKIHWSALHLEGIFFTQASFCIITLSSFGNIGSRSREAIQTYRQR